MKNKKELSVGNSIKLPHYAVVGTEVDLYLWVNESGRGTRSTWIKGNNAHKLWAVLSASLIKDKKTFIKILKEEHSKRPTNRHNKSL